jgi:WD40 repeat protein
MIAGAALLALIACDFAPCATAVFADEEIPRSTPANAAHDTESIRSARALLQLGTSIFRTRDSIRDLAFSPDGKLIAAAVTNHEHPQIWLFDAQTGRAVKQIVIQNKPLAGILCLAFAPDQSKLLWGESGGLVGLWDLKNDRLIFRDPVHDGIVNEVAFSPGGTLFASAGQDGDVHLRRLADPMKTIRTLSTEEKRPRQVGGTIVGGSGARSLAFTPDEKHLVVGGASTGDISIFNVEDGALVQSMDRAHGTSRGFGNPRLNQLAVTPDGREILSAGQHTVPKDETKLKTSHGFVPASEIRFWNIESGLLARELKGDQDYGFGYAALSPDGKRVAVMDFALLRILDSKTGKALQTTDLPGQWGSKPRFSPDGRLVAMALGNTVGVFDAQTGKRLFHDEKMPDGSLTSAAWSPKGDQIATGHGDGQVRLSNARTGDVIWHQLLAPVVSRTGWSASIGFLGYTPSGRQVVAAGRRDDPVEYRNGIVVVFDAVDGRKLREVVVKQPIRWGALSSDGKRLVVGGTNGAWDDTHLIGIEIETGKIVFSNPPEEQRGGFVMPSALRFLPDSKSFQLATHACDVIRLDSTTGGELHRFIADIRTPQQLRARRARGPQMGQANFTRDGKTLVFSSADSVYVWDTQSERIKVKNTHPHEHGCFLSISPDETTLATSDLQYVNDYGSDTIRLFNVQTGERLMVADPDNNRADVLAFSPDGTKLFTGYYRGTATIWDVRR